MTSRARHRIGLGWGISLILVVSGLVATTGVGTAGADDGGPSAPPSETATASPSAEPTAEPSPTPVTPDAAPAPEAPPAPAAPAPPAGGRVGGTFTPPDGITFNYPYAGKKARYAIRQQVLQTIKAVPSGGAIRVAAYSINDHKTVHQLIQAAKR
ncbi:MAG: hypothetical protein JWO46_962, partial [Nocardioidaceae bacterium]|nr:hypothetical protein [Nocardioidaceae bacterium]